MASPIHHALFAFALAGSLFGACGGKTAGENTGTGSSSGSSGGSGGSSSGSTTGSSSGFSGTSSGVGTPPVPPSCVFIDASSFDQTCNVASDCFLIATGTICAGSCFCAAGAAINVGEVKRYQAEVSAVATCEVPCPQPFSAACSGNVCVVCSGLPSDPPGCLGPPRIDAGVVVCKQGPGSGWFGSNGCNSLQTNESCSDGTTYSATCRCPDAVCTCNQSGPNGGSSSGGHPFGGCKFACNAPGITAAYDACGFPLPQ